MPGEHSQQDSTSGLERRDEWEQWDESGPLLRADSYSARQLFYLSSEAVYLESRGLFIGDFPPNWVEENCLQWLNSIRTVVDSLYVGETSEPEHSRNYLEQRRFADLELATEIVQKTDSSLRDHSSKRQRLLRQMQRRRNRFRKDLLEQSVPSGVNNTESPNNEDTRSPSTKQDSFNETSSLVEADKPLGTNNNVNTLNSGSIISSSSDSTIFFDCESLPRQYTVNRRSCSTLKDDLGQTSFNESNDAVLLDADINCLRSSKSSETLKGFQTSRVDRNFENDITIQETGNDNTANDAKCLKYDGLMVENTSNRGISNVNCLDSTGIMGQEFDTRENSNFGSARPKVGTLSDQKLPQNYPLHMKGSNKKLESGNTAEPQNNHIVKQSTVQILPSVENVQHNSSVSCKISPSAKKIHTHTPASSSSDFVVPANLNTDHSSGKRHRVSFHHHSSDVKKVYNGHFLVQERRSHSMRPIVDELEAPLATNLVSRWKEVALMVQKSDSINRPLKLYFYSTSTKEKLARKSKRKWTRRLEYKVSLDKHYEIALFSPLDLTLALWRPRNNQKHHNRRSGRGHPQFDGNNGHKHTQVLLIHSKSIVEIMDLAFLVASTTSAASKLHGTLKLDVEVPEVDVKTKVKTYSSIRDVIYEIRETSNKEALISYQDIQKPIASVSNSLLSLMEAVYKLTKDIHRAKKVSEAYSEGQKYAMAWISHDIHHRPLWLPSSSLSLYPITRLNWLLGRNSRLFMIKGVPKCYNNESSKEPSPIEGYCGRVNLCFNSKSTKNICRSNKNYLWTCDYYLMCCPSNIASPPMLASGCNDLVKPVEPYALDDKKSIRWIKNSTCLHEIDHHDAIAKLEHERRVGLVSQARGFINLTQFNSFKVNQEGDVEISGDRHNTHCVFSFENVEIANVWSQNLQMISEFWQTKLNASVVQHAVETDQFDFTITPYLQNRTIVYSGLLFLKGHRFAIFKAYHVILTPKELVIFRVHQSIRVPAQPSQSIPSASLIYRHYKNIDLSDTYIYTGRVASHSLLDTDNYRDPSNPGVRALPRVYDNGCISQDTESDRCFVIWRASKQRMSKIKALGTGVYVAFLAPQKIERDKWVAAIRYVQSRLCSKFEKNQNPLNVDEIEDFINE